MAKWLNGYMVTGTTINFVDSIKQLKFNNLNLMFRYTVPILLVDYLFSTKVNATLSLLIVGAEHRNIYQIVTRVIVSLFHKKRW